MRVEWAGYWLALLALIGIGTATWFITKPADIPRNFAPLSHQAYVGQRNWDDSVRAAVAASGKSFERLITIAAQVSWKEGEADAATIHPDYAFLRTTGTRVGLVMRVGELPPRHDGAFDATSAQTKFVVETARESIRYAKRKGIAPCEFQVDFDAADSELSEYAHWVKAVKEAIKPLAVVIVARPAWLDRPEFAEIARTAGEFVLQAHSIRTPKDAEQKLTTCDPSDVRRWVEQAARANVPFRISLPTYGYIAAFTTDGRALGVSTDAGGLWPEGAILKGVQSDPEAMAKLIGDWTISHPEMLKSILWYRLPVEEDSMTWRQATLEKVMRGQAPTTQATTARG